MGQPATRSSLLPHPFFPPRHSVAGLLAAGQVAMGVGKGSLITAQKVFLKQAARPDEVSLYFALSFSTSHSGTFLAFLLSPLVTAASPMYVPPSALARLLACLRATDIHPSSDDRRLTTD